ncbi:unnamed protein product [Miscanthus lutarioriparius]|uniref:DUF4220 domain-containing protein n=1 Tax=Miscanthus lutarioriparius TaxID=422564 RepID=A0A811RGF7_9POAL|nr:unnamed protein product [Miscanthus lutarioriparius]
MGNMSPQHLGNAASEESLLHQLRDMWKSPRGTVLRIEALALVAIALSFFLAAFGYCRRWSKSWIIQKGFLAANALFLSLGTYSIGLMQSSRVKSEMYPIWAVSLLALLCCVDSAAASGLDNKNQLWKMLYQLCLYFGYVLLMSITTISSDIGNVAICVLAAVTFMKGFHRSMALVLPSSMRNMIREIPAHRIRKCSFGDADEEKDLIVDRKLDVIIGYRREVDMGDIASMSCEEGISKIVESALDACKDVCLSFSLSHLLHRRFLGLSSGITPAVADSTKPLIKNYERAYKVAEIELAFLYDILYTSNTFLHYYEAKNASVWAFASVVGICFVGAVAAIPGMRMTHRAAPAGTIFVNTTTADYVITGVILVSLALLQVVQMLRCWTSNWSRVSFARDWVSKILDKSNHHTASNVKEEKRIKADDVSWGMRLRAYLLKINWYDDKYYLWQNKLGQHSVIEESGSIMVGFWGFLGHHRCHQVFYNRIFCCGFLVNFCGCIPFCTQMMAVCLFLEQIIGKCCSHLKSLVKRCLGLLGLQYIRRELQEMLKGGSRSPRDLHCDVKTSIGCFILDKMRSDEVSGWASSEEENRQRGCHLPDFSVKVAVKPSSEATDRNAMIYVSCILMWHIATCYCELHDQVHVVDEDNKDRGVATALSKYCAYLVASAPRLLPGRFETTKWVYAQVREVVISWTTGTGDKLRAMDSCNTDDITLNPSEGVGYWVYALGVKLGKGLTNKEMAPADRWKLLVDFWVKALVYAAPSDDVEEHMQYLSQGGELITHLWAMLYHAGIQKWQLNPPAQDCKMGWDYIFRIRSWNDLAHHMEQTPRDMDAV